MQIQMTEPHFSRGLCMHNTVIMGPIWKCNYKVQVETNRRITHCSKSILIQKLFCLLDAGCSHWQVQFETNIKLTHSEII